MILLTPSDLKDLIQDYAQYILAKRTGNLSEIQAHEKMMELDGRQKGLAKKYKRQIPVGVVIAGTGFGLIVADAYLASNISDIAQNIAETVNSVDSAQLIEKGLQIVHYVLTPVKYALSIGGGVYALTRYSILDKVRNLGTDVERVGDAFDLPPNQEHN